MGHSKEVSYKNACSIIYDVLQYHSRMNAQYYRKIEAVSFQCHGLLLHYSLF